MGHPRKTPKFPCCNAGAILVLWIDETLRDHLWICKGCGEAWNEYWNEVVGEESRWTSIKHSDGKDKWTGLPWGSVTEFVREIIIHFMEDDD